jgi:hypothetical protein
MFESYEESVHLLDGDGRVLASLKKEVGKKRRGRRVSADAEADCGRIIEILFRLDRKVVETVHYLVTVHQVYRSSKFSQYSDSSVTVSIIPSKEALFLWMDLHKSEQKLISSGKR